MSRMFYVYVLQSKKDEKFYIGYTSDLKNRFNQHCEGSVQSTKNRRPLHLIYYEAYTNEAAARNREANLKKFGSAYTALTKRLQLN